MALSATERMRNWRANNPGRAKLQWRKDALKKYYKDPAKDAARKAAHRKAYPEQYKEKMHTYYLANKEKWKYPGKKSRLKLKLDVLIAYGGHCACCGENQYEFLSLDHKNNDGAAHRRTLKTRSEGVYRQVRQQGYPEGFQVLCMNCNFAKGMHGACPHGNS